MGEGNTLSPPELLELVASEVRRRSALPGDPATALRSLADELDELRGLLLAPPRAGPWAPGRTLAEALEASGVEVERLTPIEDDLQFPVAAAALTAAIRRLAGVASRGFGERGVALEYRPATAASLLLTLRPHRTAGRAGAGLGRLRLDLDLALARALLEGIGGAIELEASDDQLRALRVELPASPDSVARLRTRLINSALAEMRDELGAELLASVELLDATLRSARRDEQGAPGRPTPGLGLARQQAHKLRGSAGSCGFPALSVVAAVVEDALLAATGPLSPEAWTRLDEALVRMRAALREPPDEA
jgi:HPt (histidine-containing phosphotransfer) domain-containing protein